MRSTLAAFILLVALPARAQAGDDAVTLLERQGSFQLAGSASSRARLEAAGFAALARGPLVGLGELARAGDPLGAGERLVAFEVPALERGGWLSWLGRGLARGARLCVHDAGRVSGCLRLEGDERWGLAWLEPGPGPRLVAIAPEPATADVWELAHVRLSQDLPLPSPFELGASSPIPQARLGQLSFELGPRDQDSLLGFTLPANGRAVEVSVNGALVAAGLEAPRDAPRHVELILPARVLDPDGPSRVLIAPEPGPDGRPFVLSGVTVSRPLAEGAALEPEAPELATREGFYTFTVHHPGEHVLRVRAEGVEREGQVEVWLNGAFLGALPAGAGAGAARLSLPASLQLAGDVNLLKLSLTETGSSGRLPRILELALARLEADPAESATGLAGSATDPDGAFGSRRLPGQPSTLVRPPDGRPGLFPGAAGPGPATPFALASVRPRLAAAPPAAPRSLQIDSQPQGAAVFVSASPLYRGSFMGTTPLRLDGLPDGIWKVGLSAAGYHPVSSVTRVEARSRFKLETALMAWQGLHFSEPSVLPLVAGLSYAVPALCDIDEDGRFDLVIGDASGALSWARDEASWGMPRFAQPRPIETSQGPARVSAYAYPRSLDIDGDGRDDLLVGEGGGSVMVYNRSGAAGQARFELAGPVMAAGAPLSVANGAAPLPADWDGDSRVDLLVGSGFGRLMLYRGLARGGFGPGEPVRAGGQPVRGTLNLMPIDRADWNGDGIDDLVMGTLYGSLELYAGQAGSEELGLPRPLDGPFNAGAYATGLAYDLDGDGYRDLLLGNGAGELVLLRGGEPRPLDLALLLP